MTSKSQCGSRCYLLPILLMPIFIISYTTDSSITYGQLENTNSSNSNNSVSNATEWKTYSSDVVGISFDYPSDWNLEEKVNRFDTGPDVTVSDGSTKFFIMKLDEEGNEAMKLFGLADATKFMEGGETEDIDSTVIEKTSLTKYELGGEKTGTFLLKTEKGLLERAQQFFIVEHDGQFYTISFLDSTETFDEPKIQEIMNKIIQSIIFL